jgi:hypothetical protein
MSKELARFVQLVDPLRGVVSKNIIIDWPWILRDATRADLSAGGTGDLPSHTEMTPPQFRFSTRHFLFFRFDRAEAPSLLGCNPKTSEQKASRG